MLMPEESGKVFLAFVSWGFAALGFFWGDPAPYSQIGR